MQTWQLELDKQTLRYHLTSALWLNVGFVIFALADYMGRTWEVFVHFTLLRLAVALGIAVLTFLTYRQKISPIVLGYGLVLGISGYMIYVSLHTPLEEIGGVVFAQIVFYVVSGFIVLWHWQHTLVIACVVIGAQLSFSLQQMSFTDFIRHMHGTWYLLTPLVVIAVVRYRYLLAKREIVLKLNLLEKNEEISQQREELLTQNQLIETNNRALSDAYQQITDSVNYAKRLQRAMLPNSIELGQLGQERFVIYRPKDIVSGDFYWLKQVDEEAFFLAVADCTGHGIPGGFLTVIGQSTLNQLIVHEKHRDTGKILQLLDERLLQILGQAADTKTIIADGMDLVLLRLNPKRKEIAFATANRPLWRIHNGQLMHYKASRSAIGGGLTEQKVFEETIIPYHEGDSLYLFSDGYPDQFGHAQRKFMVKQFRQLIQDIAHYPMPTQESILLQTMQEWQGDTPQTDDWLIVGIKL
ncbi:PP2C family protein-serine/threonine phosphatase [Eisenibacter elegans]|uniref:PP2C family protein-serine/threonine phosphatase n=1 Tax=Eisenibacter elegans TaxID=997 RepID=UPI00042837D3|nr:SpoIIE family protein phosphatase [Eisenibacter elegans]